MTNFIIFNCCQLPTDRVGRERYDFVNVCCAKMDFWVYLLVSCAVFVNTKAGKLMKLYFQFN